MTELEKITRRAEVYSKARELLVAKVAALNEGISALRRDMIPDIKRAVARAADAEAALRALVEQNPELFQKPKTQIFSGVKVGYQKGKGTIDFDDADTVVARIKKHFPDQADVLIKVKETPVKDALTQLSAADLKRIGVTVTASGDQVVVKPVDSEVDKMVDALLKDAVETD